MRAYESWGSGRGGYGQPSQKLHLFNAVNGNRIFSHNPNRERMADLSLRTWRYYDAFPEVCDSPMSVMDVKCQGCIAQLFEGPPRVVTAGNATDQRSEAFLNLAVPGAVLFDCVDGTRVPVVNGQAVLSLEPWEFRAFEIRP